MEEQKEGWVERGEEERQKRGQRRGGNVRVREGLLLAFSDVIDTFVVAAKHRRRGLHKATCMCIHTPCLGTECAYTMSLCVRFRVYCVCSGV